MTLGRKSAARKKDWLGKENNPKYGCCGFGEKSIVISLKLPRFNQTSKTEVLQMPSAKDVFQGDFEFFKKNRFFKIKLNFSRKIEFSKKKRIFQKKIILSKKKIQIFF